jgi:hypothetical protein
VPKVPFSGVLGHASTGAANTCQRAMRQAGAAAPTHCQDALSDRIALARRLREAGHRPNVFGPYGFPADHKLIDLKATNGEFLRRGVADPKTSHGHGTDR